MRQGICDLRFAIWAQRRPAVEEPRTVAAARQSAAVICRKKCGALTSSLTSRRYGGMDHVRLAVSSAGCKPLKRLRLLTSASSPRWKRGVNEVVSLARLPNRKSQIVSRKS
jgi:hypothetical protein